MTRLFILLLLSATCFFSQAQQTLQIKVISAENKAPLPATVLLKGTPQGYSTDSTGIVSVLFPAPGNYALVTSAVGYNEKQTKVTVPHPPGTIEIELESIGLEMEEVIVQSTRTSRAIANVPTRVETIGLEEIDEKSNMRPANVAMILHESTGIQVQQTSATSGNASIRIQGLDGRYTQLLKDGFPTFGNFSSGLSVLEIPPLDLKQVEIIKGPASPLFGGGAIAGVVNFVSRTPQVKPSVNLILNQSNIGQRNAGIFASARNKKTGFTMLALYNTSKPYDVDKDDFTEVPKSSEYTFHPKLFIYPDEHTTITIGNSLSQGSRTGGDIQVIKHRAGTTHQYFETNKTLRNISTFELDKKIGEKKRFVAKQAFNFFQRTINIPSYIFEGLDYTAFTDVSYVSNAGKHALVLGGNFIYNKFKQRNNGSGNLSNTSRTTGVYGQHTWDATGSIKLESGLRVDIADYRNAGYTKSEIFVLPRVSVLVNYGHQWSSRISAGMGYKTPSLFTEQTETIQYRHLAQLSNVQSEKSYGGTADVNFRANITEELAFTFNHMFFYTTINKPLILATGASGLNYFLNASNPVHSAGFETNARFIYQHNFKLFLGYTFNHTKASYLPGNQFLPMVPKNKLNMALIYEKEGAIKLGLEGYFTGTQYLTNGTRTPSFSEFGFMAEKIFNRVSLYINFENLTDTRQSKYKNVVNGSHLDPTFDEIWTHTEGFVINGGIKLRL